MMFVDTSLNLSCKLYIHLFNRIISFYNMYLPSRYQSAYIHILFIGDENVFCFIVYSGCKSSLLYSAHQQHIKLSEAIKSQGGGISTRAFKKWRQRCTSLAYWAEFKTCKPHCKKILFQNKRHWWFNIHRHNRTYKSNRQLQSWQVHPPCHLCQ